MLNESPLVIDSTGRIHDQDGINRFRKMIPECSSVTVDRHDILDALLVGECFGFIEQLFVEIRSSDTPIITDF